MSQVGTTKSTVAIRKKTKKQDQIHIETVNHNMTADQRQSMIQTAAYLRAEKRGFQNGSPVQDWIDAEREIDAMSNGVDHNVHAVTH